MASIPIIYTTQTIVYDNESKVFRDVNNENVIINLDLDTDYVNTTAIFRYRNDTYTGGERIRFKTIMFESIYHLSVDNHTARAADEFCFRNCHIVNVAGQTLFVRFKRVKLINTTFAFSNEGTPYSTIFMRSFSYFKDWHVVQKDFVRLYDYPYRKHENRVNYHGLMSASPKRIFFIKEDGTEDTKAAVSVTFFRFYCGAFTSCIRLPVRVVALLDVHQLSHLYRSRFVLFGGADAHTSLQLDILMNARVEKELQSEMYNFMRWVFSTCEHYGIRFLKP